MQKETLLTTNTHFETKWEKQLSARTLKFIRMLKIESRDEQHCNLGKSKLKPLMISVASSCSFQYFLFLEALLFPVHYVTADSVCLVLLFLSNHWAPLFCWLFFPLTFLSGLFPEVLFSVFSSTTGFSLTILFIHYIKCIKVNAFKLWHCC